MIVADQVEVVAFLSRPESYGGGVAAVEHIQTQVSEVFLAGRRAFKLKRAVRFPYLDFSTAELRRAACEAEVAVNRRTAPSLYRGVVAVRRGAGGVLSLGGPGRAVDWLVEMARFDEDGLFDHMARAGTLDDGTMEETAAVIAGFHAAAEVRAGPGAAMAAIVDNNTRCLAEAGAALDAARVARLDAAARRAAAECAALLDERRSAGRVRHCHGDLHLRNICLLDGRPTLFDAIEFRPELAHIDVLYDLAFLLMDLDHRGLGHLASIVLNRYLDTAGDAAGLVAMPLFLSTRAAVRCHVGAAAAPQARRRESAQYLQMAIAYLSPAAPRLIAVGGLSGSGKSFLARRLAPHVGAAPGARVVRSDVTRKRLAGVEPLDRLGPEGYTAPMTERTYRAVYEEARAVLGAGHSVIADAVFAAPAERGAIAALARDAGVPFRGLWLDAPAAVLEERVRARRGDASDATPEVAAMQRRLDTGEVGWERLDASGSIDDTLRRGLELVP